MFAVMAAEVAATVAVAADMAAAVMAAEVTTAIMAAALGWGAVTGGLAAAEGIGAGLTTCGPGAPITGAISPRALADWDSALGRFLI